MSTVDRGELVPGYVPPDEGYWAALLGGARPQTVPPTDRLPDEPDGRDQFETVAEPAQAEDPWLVAQEWMEDGRTLTIPVVGCNRGGLMVSWKGLRGFVPASHLLDLAATADEETRHDELRALVGTSLDLQIIELDPSQNRFVLSQRATVRDEDRRQALLDELAPGDVREGEVTNLCSFGAFVDLGGLEGLVHVSELSWGRVDHPRDVLEPGQPVQVYVLNVDGERGRVGLSIKRLRPDPWLSVEERYEPGQVLDATITHIVDFGAFARVEEGLEGLIHISELPENHFGHPRDVVDKGDELRVRVLNVDGERRRMGLSLRGVDSVEGQDAAPSATEQE